MAKDDIWTTKDGNSFRMCEMTDSHLKNAINYFMPRNGEFKERWKLLMTEKKRRDKLVPDKPINSRFDILDI